MSEQQQRRRRRRRRRSRERREEAAGEGGAPPVAGDEAVVVRQPDRGKGDRSRSSAQAAAKPKTIMGMPRTMFALTAGLFAALLLVIIVGQFTTDTNGDLGGVDRFPDQGRRHLAAGETFDAYNSDPPTSGPQAALGVPSGIYGPEQPPPFDLEPPSRDLLPVLERGGLVIYYNPARIEDAVLRALVGGVEQRIGQGVDLVLTARSGLDAAVVATAWRHLLRFEDFDADASDDLAAFWALAPDGYYLRFVLERQAKVATLSSAD